MPSSTNVTVVGVQMGDQQLAAFALVATREMVQTLGKTELPAHLLQQVGAIAVFQPAAFGRFDAGFVRPTTDNGPPYIIALREEGLDLWHVADSPDGEHIGPAKIDDALETICATAEAILKHLPDDAQD